MPRILAVHNRRLGSPLGREDLADLTQECLIVIWRKIDEFDPHTLFESWAYRICLFELMNHLRKAHRRRNLLVTLAERALDREEGADEAPLDELERQEIVYRALEVLEGEEAAVVRMRCFEERTFEEVGERLRIPVGTAKTRYYRGLTKMKDFVTHGERGGER